MEMETSRIYVLSKLIIPFAQCSPADILVPSHVGITLMKSFFNQTKKKNGSITVYTPGVKEKLDLDIS